MTAGTTNTAIALINAAANARRICERIRSRLARVDKPLFSRKSTFGGGAIGRVTKATFSTRSCDGVWYEGGDRAASVPGADAIEQLREDNAWSRMPPPTGAHGFTSGRLLPLRSCC